MKDLKKSFMDFFHTREDRGLHWVNTLFAYYRDHHFDVFELLLEQALRSFFPLEHTPIPLEGNERVEADDRFWDYFLFEYQSSFLDQKTPVEFLAENRAELSESDTTDFERLSQTHFYSLFRIISIKEGYSLRVEDLFDAKAYEIREELGTYQAEMGQVIIGRILKDEKDEYRFAPGNLKVFPLEVGISMGKRFGHFEQRITALQFEKTYYQEAQFPRVQIGEQAEEDLADFLHRYGSDYTVENLKTLIYDQAENKLMDLPSLILQSCTKVVPKYMIQELIDLLMVFFNQQPQSALEGKSPEEMEEMNPKGPKEKALRQALLNDLAFTFDDVCFPTQKASEFILEKYQRVWLNTPQSSLSGKTPRSVIDQERKAQDPHAEIVEDTLFTISRNPIHADEKKIIPLKDIDATNISFLQDMYHFLEYVKERKMIKLSPRRLDMRMDTAQKLAQKFKRKGMIEYKLPQKKSAYLGFFYTYVDFVWRVAVLSGLVERDGNTLSIDLTAYKKFQEKPSGEQLLELFCAWWCHEAWDSFLAEYEIEEDPVVGEIIEDSMKKRESVVANLDYVGTEKISFRKDLFWHFFGSRQEYLEQPENAPLREAIELNSIRFMLQHFNIFGLLHCFSKSCDRLIFLEDLLTLDSVQVTKVGSQLLPYIGEYLFLHGLDLRGVRGAFDPKNADNLNEMRAAESPIQVSKVGRNDSCPCGSGKKYKKCCLST